MEQLLLPAVHFVALIAFLTYKMKAPFATFMVDRHQHVVTGFNRSKAQAAQAETKRKEIDAKLANLDREKDAILNEWKEREALQLKAVTESSARVILQMKAEAQRNKAALEETFRTETIRGIGKLVLAQAEAKIKSGLTPEKHQNINKRFAQELTVGA